MIIIMIHTVSIISSIIEYVSYNRNAFGLIFAAISRKKMAVKYWFHVNNSSINNHNSNTSNSNNDNSKRSNSNSNNGNNHIIINNDSVGFTIISTTYTYMLQGKCQSQQTSASLRETSAKTAQKKCNKLPARETPYTARPGCRRTRRCPSPRPSCSPGRYIYIYICIYT